MYSTISKKTGKATLRIICESRPITFLLAIKFKDLKIKKIINARDRLCKIAKIQNTFLLIITLSIKKLLRSYLWKIINLVKIIFREKSSNSFGIKFSFVSSLLLNRLINNYDKFKMMNFVIISIINVLCEIIKKPKLQCSVFINRLQKNLNIYDGNIFF